MKRLYLILSILFVCSCLALANVPVPSSSITASNNIIFLDKPHLVIEPVYRDFKLIYPIGNPIVANEEITLEIERKSINEIKIDGEVLSTSNTKIKIKKKLKYGFNTFDIISKNDCHQLKVFRIYNGDEIQGRSNFVTLSKLIAFLYSSEELEKGYKFKKSLRRIEMARILYKLRHVFFNMDKVKKIVFQDIEKTNNDYLYAKFAVGKQYMNEFKGYFYPKKQITYTEAVKIIVKLLESEEEMQKEFLKKTAKATHPISHLELLELFVKIPKMNTFVDEML